MWKAHSTQNVSIILTLVSKIHNPHESEMLNFFPRVLSLTGLPLYKLRHRYSLYVLISMQASKNSLVILLLSLAFNVPQGRKICFICNLSTQ